MKTISSIRSLSQLLPKRCHSACLLLFVSFIGSLSLKTKAEVGRDMPTPLHSTVPEVIIRVDPGMVTLVTSFTCAQEDQKALIDLLISGTKEIMKRQTGFISSTVLRGEGTKVINYSQWKSRDDISRMRQQEDAKEYFGKVSKLSRFESVICHVAHVEVGGRVFDNAGKP